MPVRMERSGQSGEPSSEKRYPWDEQTARYAKDAKGTLSISIVQQRPGLDAPHVIPSVSEGSCVRQS